MTRSSGLPSALAASALAFCAGAGVLALEITAARVFIPWFGASIVVWSNVIGVTLLAVAAGNFLGGRLAERRPDSNVLACLLVVAGVLAAAFPYLASALARRYLPAELPLDIAFSVLGRASLIVALATLAPPLVLVGATSPFLVRAVAADGRVGRAAGWIAGSGTLGSLVGTWLPVYYAIPQFGSRTTCLLAGALLTVAGLFCVRRSRIGAAAAALVLLAIGGTIGSTHDQPVMRGATTGLVLEEIETAYQYARVERDGPRTLLRLNEGLDSFHSLTVEGELLTGAYYDPFLLLPALAPQVGDTYDIVVLGFAAGTWGRQLLAANADRPELRVIGVELDPAIVRLGQQYFGGLDDERLVIVSDQDARVFLDRCRDRFELILVDTYASQVYVPFQTCSVEFFRSARERLAPGGLLAANLGGVSFEDEPLTAIRNTCAKVFSSVALERFARGRNFVLLAAEAGKPPRLSAAAEVVEPPLRRIAEEQAANGLRREFEYEPKIIVLTDDRSSIERLCDLDLERRAARELDGPSASGFLDTHDLEKVSHTWAPEDRQAISRAETLVEEQPDSLVAWQQLAFLRFRLDDQAGALAALARADAIDAGAHYTAYLRGVLFESRCEFAEARAAYEEARRRSNGDPAANAPLESLAARVAAVERFQKIRERLDTDTWMAGVFALTLAIVAARLSGGPRV